MYPLSFTTKAHRHLWCAIIDVNGTKLALVLLNIILQSTQKTLGMLGRHDDARHHLRTLCTGESGCEIQNKLGLGMTNNSQIGIFTNCHFGRDGYLYLIFLFHIFTYLVSSNESLSCGECDAG